MRPDWMGASMFSSGLGLEGNRQIVEANGEGLTIVEDAVDTEKVGLKFEEKFQWFMTSKGGGGCCALKVLMSTGCDYDL